MESKGSIEVICGGMFSGKTEEMIRRLRRVVIAKQSLQVFKPMVDTRFKSGKITSHSGEEFDAVAVEKSQDILDLALPEILVVAIDEAQFFDAGIVEVADKLCQTGKRVIINGLNLDFKGEPFGSMPDLMAKADDITLLKAICVVCGDLATRTQRLVNGRPAKYTDPLVVIGAEESYEARCRKHHEIQR